MRPASPQAERRFDDAFQAELAELIAWRRDVRRFRADAVPEATLDVLFRLADLAPSVGNCQPTRFVRVDDAGRRAAVRANFAAANRDALAGLSRRAGGALRKAEARGPERSAGPSRGLLRRRDDAGSWARGAHHARDAPLLRRLRPPHLLARRAGAWARRRLGVDPRSGRPQGDARRSAGWSFVGYLCVGWPEGAPDAGAGAGGLAGPDVASGCEEVRAEK